MSSSTSVMFGDKRLVAWFTNDFEIHNIGDVIPWKPEFDYPGEWLDGVHEAEDQDTDKEYRVVIKNQKIVYIYMMCPSRSWIIAVWS